MNRTGIEKLQATLVDKHMCNYISRDLLKEVEAELSVLQDKIRVLEADIASEKDEVYRLRLLLADRNACNNILRNHIEDIEADLSSGQLIQDLIKIRKEEAAVAKSVDEALQASNSRAEAVYRVVEIIKERERSD